jgi:hypothetical protein
MRNTKMLTDNHPGNIVSNYVPPYSYKIIDGSPGVMDDSDSEQS